MKKLAVVCLSIAIVVGLAVSILGVPDLSYSPPISDRYLWGAAHVHSNLSDGRASLEEVARAAARSRLDFVMLGDHGPPHREAALFDETLEGVRFVGGSEVELPEGRLIVSDPDTLSRFKLPPYPPDAIADAHEWGGFTIVAYPNDPARRWTYWENDFLPDGVEIMNVTSQLREIPPFERLRWAWMSLFGAYDTVSRFAPPTDALERWDDLLERGPVWGFFAADAHGGAPLTASSSETALPFPSYETVFSYVALGVDRSYGDDPMRAIRRGDFFAVIRGAGEPERFAFHAGDDRPPGSFVPTGTALRVELEAPNLAPRIVLKRDGETLSETTKAALDIEASPGVYRVEVYLEGHPLLASDVPWILSNPIFVGLRYPPVVVEELTCSDVEPFALGELLLEKDNESAGLIETTENGAVKLWFRLSTATPANPDRWVAFALRKPLDLSASRGIVLEADAPRRMRLWIEVRSEERSHYSSIKLEKGHNRVAIPWTRFYATSGDHERIRLGQLDSVFLTVNTSNSFTGFRRALTVSSFGACR